MMNPKAESKQKKNGHQHVPFLLAVIIIIHFLHKYIIRHPIFQLVPQGQFRSLPITRRPVREIHRKQGEKHNIERKIDELIPDHRAVQDILIH